MRPRLEPKRWPACHLCNNPAALRSGIGTPWCLSHFPFLLVTDRLLVPPPAVLDQTAPQNAGPSPFCEALLATMGRAPLWSRLCPTCAGDWTCPTADVPEPTHCSECCDCTSGTCHKCGAYDESEERPVFEAFREAVRR
jgi:hypothetical protein